MPPDLTRNLTADRGDAGRRLDLVVRRHLSDVGAASRTQVQAWIEGGRVLVKGVAVRRTSARVAWGDVVSVVLPDTARPHVMAAEDQVIDVLFEDEDLLAVNKPAGVVVHPSYKNVQGTMMNALLWRARSWPEGQRPSIVGRLDKFTSGIVVVAKNGGIHAALQRAMAASDCQKDYLAIVYGRVNVPRGRIDLRLARDPGDRRRVVASATVGAMSLTLFERLARVPAPRVGLSLLRCRLVTGRTHQIRVHLAARDWPLVGDPKYGAPRWANVVDPALAAALKAFPRQALHAWRLAIPHPRTGVPLSIEAPIPADLESLLSVAQLGSSRTLRTPLTASLGP